jgi:serine/tyrosine/threonine adenylyltransferase
MTNIGWKFDNSYTQLSQNIMSRTLPTKVKSPKIVIVNYELAKQLGLDFSSLNNEELAKLFTGMKFQKDLILLHRLMQVISLVI